MVSMNTTDCWHPALARSLRFLEHNWQRPINVSDLVAASGLSRRGFIKAFHRHTGCAPGRELRRLRMLHARHLLTQTQHPVAEVAERCGYRSVNSFIVAFHRFSGRPPQQYRRELSDQRQRDSRGAEFPSRFAQSPEHRRMPTC